MNIISNIFGAIVLAILLLLGWMLVAQSQLSYTKTEFEKTEQSYTQKKISSDFDSVLRATEPDSELSLAALLADSIYYGKSTLEYGSHTVDILSAVQPAFDAVYGAGNYYLEISPQTDGKPALQLGIKKPQSERYSLERVLPLPRQIYANAKLIVYREKEA